MCILKMKIQILKIGTLLILCHRFQEGELKYYSELIEVLGRACQNWRRGKWYEQNILCEIKRKYTIETILKSQAIH